MPIPYKKLKNLAEVQKLQDSDITVIEDQDTTRKGTLKQLIQYVKEHNDISSFYAHQEAIGAANGIAPLDDKARLPSEFLSYGKETGKMCIRDRLYRLRHSFYPVKYHLHPSHGNCQLAGRYGGIR